MNKTERRKQINSRFYAYVENNFPQYTIDFGEGYGRVYLIPQNKNSNDSIMYHQSEHYVLCLSYASPEVQEDVIKMQKYITTNIIPFIDNMYL